MQAESVPSAAGPELLVVATLWLPKARPPSWKMERSLRGIPGGGLQQPLSGQSAAWLRTQAAGRWGNLTGRRQGLCSWEAPRWKA